MSKIISENQEAWSKKSWINELVNNTKLANSLTEEYAHDVLEAVGEDYFPSLDSALADLSSRTGLTASETNEIRKVAIAMVTKKADIHGPTCECEEIPGNKEVPGHKLVKESPEVAASTAPDVTAGMPEHLKQYQFKKKEDKAEGEAKTEEKKEEGKKEEASVKADKKAWFQGADEPTKEGEVTTNDPKKMGYPKEMTYDKKPMETSAPGGKDTRPWEQNWFEGSAEETKKVMGPKGEEFELKVEMQRIPKGEKPANASARRLNELKAIAGKKKEINKQASEYSSDAQAFISKEIKHLMDDKGYDHDRAVGAAMSIAREKGYKVPEA